MKRRILSIITALALCLSLCPTWALAAEADPALCKHHPEHTEDCGYTVPAEGQPCGHEHTDECYTLGALPDTDGGAPYEIGADTENLLDCQHTHDSECGYAQADPGQPCGFVCRICPIEALIAALPEQVTEDNADDVRAQLDHILDLYRELDEDEQGQIDLSRVTELQGALDGANDPAPITESVEYQEASWDGSQVTYESKTETCTLVENSAEAVTWNAGWYVVNSTVTIDQPITVNGEVNLILTDGCTLTAEKGIVVTSTNSLTIYAQSEDGGTLNATGTADDSGNASAGIGGSTSSFDSGSITIHGGVINATSGASRWYSGAGIGGSTPSSGNGGNSGAIKIYGGTITAESTGYTTGAGIGGGSGGTGDGGAGTNIIIYGGSITATSHSTGNGGAGIGGGSGQQNGGTGDAIAIHGGVVRATGGSLGAGIGGGGGGKKSGDGTVTISGGTVTAVGGSNAAGIGGGGGYSGDYGMNITGGTGSVTITGGIVDATENGGGASIGNGGNASGGSVEKTTGIVFENGVGTVCGTVTFNGSYNVPADYSLNIPAGASLSGSGTLSGGGAFTTENLTEDMISVPTDFYYNGEDRTTELTEAVAINGGVTICGQTFTVSGWMVEVSKTDDLHYTATYTNESDNTKNFTKTITLQQSGTTLDGAVKTYKDGAECSDFTADDTITVKATPTATGEAPANSAMFAASFTGPGAGQMAVFVGDTQVSAPADKGADGTYTMTASAADVLVAAGGPGTGITLTAKFVGNNNMADAAGTVNINISAVAKVEKYGSTTYVGNLDDAFKTENDGATITLLKDVTRTPALDIQITCNLDLGGHTITCTYGTAISIWSNANLTIQGAGEVISTNKQAIVVAGNVTLEGGTFTSKQLYSEGVYINSANASLSVVNENVTIRNTGGGCGLAVNNAQSVQLSGGTYSGTAGAISIVGGSLTLGGLLPQGGDTRYAYFDESGTTPFTGVLGNKSLTGTVTVKKCNHTGEGVCEYTHATGTTTHQQTCLACGRAAAAEKCSFDETGACPCGAALAVALPEDLNLIYDGTLQRPAVTVTVDGITTLEKGTDYGVYYLDSVNAGNTAKVTVTGTAFNGTVEKTFAIKKATLTIKANDQTITYGESITEGTDQVTAAALCTGDTLKGITLDASTKNVPGGTITPSAAQIQNSSGADVADNYNIIYQTGTLTINPSPVTLIFNDQTIVYGSTPAEATATPASAKIEYSYTTEAGGTPTPGWPANAGTYTVTAKVEATGNYGETSETITLTINPKAVSNPTIELSDNSFVYDGTEKKPTIVVKDGEAVIPASEYTVTYSDNTDVGTATVTITNVEGNYTVSGTATFTITAKPLAGASVSATGPFTYTGSALTPDPIVTLGGQTLVKGTDYTVAYTNNTDAGTATITVTGTGNYSGTASGTFAIAKATLTVDGNGTASGTYGAKLSELTVDGLTAKLGAGTVTGTWKLTGDTVPNVGDSGEYTATFTPDSGAGNYNPLTAKVKLNIAKANYTGMTAASTSGKFGAEKTYDLSNLLPSGYELGTPTKTDTNSIFEGEPTLSGAVLTYKLADVETNKGKTGTINVPVTSSTNYEPFNLTITVTVTDKFVPTLAVNPITVTYTGEAVPSTAIKGSATVDGKAVPGIWSFGSGQALTNVADSGTKTVKFVPTDTANYAEATGTVVVTINKATPTGAPKYTAISASGKTLADAGLTTEGGTFSTAGTVAWALADTTEVTANTAYEWVFTPTDTANYNILTGKITLWPYTTPSNPGGGTYVPSGPGSSTLPVTTTGQGSSAVTTTTATPAASTQGGTATTTINTAMGNEIVKQAVANNSETVVIAPKVTGRVTKTEVSIPASTVGQIGSQTNASLTVSTPVADVTIPNGGLGSLSSAGGTVTVTAEQTGNTVELTVTAGGRAVQSVPGGVTLTVPMGNTTPGTVAVLVHENGTREVVRKSVADNGAVTIPLDGSAKLVIVDNSGYFADVPATSWAADAVAFASAHELFNGTAPGRFSPDQPMSRGMLAVVLHNLESNPAQALTGAFADVDNRQWYAGGVSWAAAQGIIGGYGNGTFGPNDNITREQLAVMLWRYAGSPAATERELHFADAYKASDWAAEALRWAVEKGVLNGKGGGILDPGGEATRAETAQMLKNFLENK